MDYVWFLKTAQHINKQGKSVDGNFIQFDWDWESFKRNILMPNKERIKQVNNFDDDRVDRLLEDGSVFINNCDGSFKDGEYGDDAEEAYKNGQIGAYPSLKNLWDLSITKWEY